MLRASALLKNTSRPALATPLFSRGLATTPPKKDTLKALAKRVNLKGEVVLVRADLNLPLSKGDGPPTITDATRLTEALPSIRLLVDAGAKVVCCSHLGRPKKAKTDEERERMRLTPVAARMSEELGFPVPALKDCIGAEVTDAVASLKDGGVLLLENTRFHKEEEKNEPAFAEKLVKSCGATIFVNDAFGAAHRAHASTAGVVPHVKHAVAGILLEKELDYLYGAVSEPKRPFAAVVGGAKVSSKISVLESLMEKVDLLVVGGGMAFTFLKARGLEVGKSLVEEDQLELAAKLEAMAKAKGVEMILPHDVIAADAFDAGAKTVTVPVDAIPSDYLGVDNGPGTTKLIQEKLAPCKTIIWNGPMVRAPQCPRARRELTSPRARHELATSSPLPCTALRRRASPCVAMCSPASPCAALRRPAPPCVALRRPAHALETLHPMVAAPVASRASSR